MQWVLTWSAAAAPSSMHACQSPFIHATLEAENMANPRPGSCAGNDQPTTGLQAVQVFVPHRGADTIKHHIHTPAIGQLFDALAEIGRGGVIDHLVGTERFGLLQFPITPRGDNGTGAKALGNEQT